MACAITGTIKLPNGELFEGAMTVVPDPSTAKNAGSHLVTGEEQEYEIVDGEVDMTLEEGRYQIRLPGTKRFWIGVPSSGSSDFNDLILSGTTTYTPDGLRGSCFISGERPTEDPGLVDGASTFHLVTSGGAIAELWAWNGTAWQQII